MAANTFKTVCGYWLTILRKYLPVQVGARRLTDIYNYVPIAPTLATSGQPTEKQFALIRDAGFTTVVNLAPHSAENALRDEPAVLASLGLRYVHLPVDFKNPTDADFVRFAETLRDARDEKVWVHCAANMRVSAFIYRYRCAVQGENPQAAVADLEKVWKPTGVWKTFIGAGGSAAAGDGKTQHSPQ